jgi:uncharacterized protein (DUF362 family)
MRTWARSRKKAEEATTMSRRRTRRQFLQHLMLMGCGAVASPLLAACAAPLRPTPLPAVPATSSSTPTPLPTAPIRKAVARPELIKYFPNVPSKVIHAHHAGVWNGDTLAPAALRQMLDAAIVELTGLSDARAAWAALFRPGERIGIKVNTISTSRYWTHVPLVMAVTECLQGAGVPAEQIEIWDRDSGELMLAGFTISGAGPGVLCGGTDMRFQEGWTVAGTPIRLSEKLIHYDAVINMPVLKVHPNTGYTFALKNYYGSTGEMEKLHTVNPTPAQFAQAIAELNALAPIRERTRLIVGDALTVCPTCAGNRCWSTAVTRDSVLMSFDPVAADRVALQLLNEVLVGEKLDPASALEMGNDMLAKAARLGLGTDDEKNIQTVEVSLK